MPGLARVADNVALAFETLRANKLRSTLTILGVVMGVTTVMAMSTIVQGVRDQIVSTIEIAGPTTFYVLKYFSQEPVTSNRVPKSMRGRPDLTLAEAERIASLPEIGYAGLWAQVAARIEREGARTQVVAVIGADNGFTEIQGGGLAEGRWFTRSELASGAPVVVLDHETSDRLFGREAPLGKRVRVGGWPVRVIGVYEPPGNIFSPPGQTSGGVMPFRTVDHDFDIDRTNGLYLPVKPRPGVSAEKAREAVIVALRGVRGLRPGDPNSFDLVTQDEILDTFNKFTGVFFIVMIVLSSVGLMVGGIGVMAIMMVSVTDRTREIGVRKAVGATRREILLQFLIEAATLTGIGGVIGVALGLAAGRGATAAMGIEATTPVGMTLVAVAVSVGVGIVFGMIPARRAASLDPIEALRYE